MSGAESTYAKFSGSPLVRGDNSNFEPALFNKVGGVRGCSGATNNVAAAKSSIKVSTNSFTFIIFCILKIF